MPRRSAAVLAALAAGLLAPLAPAPAALAGTPPSLTGSSPARTGTPPARAGVPASRAAVVDGDPLRISLDTVTPGVVPTRGPVRVGGTVTNLDTTTWTTVNLYAALSPTPITSHDELDAELAPAAEGDEPVGVARIADERARDTIAEIAPGDTVAFSFEVPRALLGVSTPGVYRFGVQAVGQGPEGRDLVADGEARTLLPLLEVGRRADPVPLAVVVPLRRQIGYAADGTLTGLSAWADVLGDGGRLRSLVDLGLSAGSRAVTYLVDPALVDAATQLAAGNPPRSLAPTVEPVAPTGPGEVAPTTSQRRVASADTLAAQVAATDWLDRLARALPGHQVLGLPYGDLDVAGAADHDPRLYDAARRRTGGTLPTLGVPLRPAVASPGGYLDEAGLALAGPDDTVLISDLMFGGAPAPAVVEQDGRRMVVTSTAPITAPGPDEPLTALSVRQRTLAEGAVRQLAGETGPLAVMLPNDWNPSTASGFFSGFDVAWLDLRPAADLAGGSATPVDLGDLTYPAAQVRSEVGADNFTAARDLSRAGDQLQDLLTLNDAVARTVRDQALTSLGYGVRSQPSSARLAAAASERWIQGRLDAVHIDAPVAVTMTGTSGRIPTTVVNDLPEPVTVGVTARSDSDQIEVDRPVSVSVPPGGRTRVLVTARAPSGGIHSITLGLTDGDGRSLGDTDELTIRSLQVSGVIWLFMAAAGLLLFGAIAVRLVRRARTALGRRRHQPAHAS